MTTADDGSTHFSCELQLLFRIGYPLVEEQISEYKVLQTEITRAVGQIQHFRREEIVDLVGCLRAWWFDHLSVQIPRHLLWKQSVERSPEGQSAEPPSRT